jgi:hypothetical protein
MSHHRVCVPSELCGLEVNTESGSITCSPAFGKRKPAQGFIRSDQVVPWKRRAYRKPPGERIPAADKEMVRVQPEKERATKRLKTAQLGFQA